MENYEARQGTALKIAVTLRDGNGIAAAGYDGTQPLSTIVWPGQDLASSFAPVTGWTTPPSLIAITISAAQTASVGPGRYQLVTTLNDSGVLVEAYECTIDIKPASASRAAPAAYTTLADLQLYGKSWLRLIPSSDDEAGFAEDQGRAREWFEDCLHAHYRAATMALVVDGQAYGPRRGGLRSTYLIGLLASNALLVRGGVREAVASKALGYICGGRIEDDLGKSFAKASGFFHRRADYLATTITAELDTNGDGTADLSIDLSCTDPMYG